MAREWETPEYRRVPGETGMQRVGRINAETAAAGLNRAVLAVPARAAPAPLERGAVGDNMTGFQRDMAVRQNATMDAIQRARDIAALRGQISTGGPLGYFTDTPQAIAADAPQRAALEKLFVRRGSAPAGAPVARAKTAKSGTAVTPQQAVDQAMTQGRTTPVVITPQDRLLAMLNNATREGLTLGEMQAATSMLPAAPKRVPAKDNAITAASSIADATYQSDLAKAAKIGSQEDKDAVIQKATDTYFNRMAAIAGAGGANLSMQEMLDEMNGGN